MHWPNLVPQPINLYSLPAYDKCPCVKGNTQVSIQVNGKTHTCPVLTVAGMLGRQKVFIASYDIISGTTEYHQVTHAYHLPSKELIKVIDHSGRFVECAPDHRFWVENKRDYVQARNLSFGDTLRHSDGNFGYDLELIRTIEDVTVFQLKVDYTRNFYANGILVSE